eukprot:Transcript_28932.p1 GENE.Transcript_28932~~Transcript_28932.p1  ORF type:complete len:519 (-),score=255.99 Transcript_28932:108-1664(-)
MALARVVPPMALFQQGSRPTRAKDDPLALAEACGAFIDATPTPFHLAYEAATQLEAAGFVEAKETAAWRPLLKPGGKYYYVRGGSLVAFVVGPAYQAGNGFNIVGAHTDSPVLKLKPSSKKSAHGYLQVNAETYGGGLWHTWFDRELSLAGAVVVREPDGSFAKKLVHVKRALLRVPTLCIHLQSADERGKFAPNKETHMQPILGMIGEGLNKTAATEAEKAAADEAAAKEKELDPRHAPELLKLLAAELGCDATDIQDFELTLCDTLPCAVWGLGEEFFSGPRLDNQVHCWQAITALREHGAALPPADGSVSLIVLFDHEEVGSDSPTGASGPLVSEVMQRITSCFAEDTPHASSEALLVTIRNSFLVSADAAHAVHPNYAEKHEANHKPKLNQGLTIKTNDNMRYATNGETGFFIRELGRRAGQGIQEFVVRNDCPCGSTIGPIISARTGLRTVDVGIPSWSMHSVRETVGVADIASCLVLFRAFFTSFAELDQQCSFKSVCRPCGFLPKNGEAHK